MFKTSPRQKLAVFFEWNRRAKTRARLQTVLAIARVGLAAQKGTRP